MSDMKGAWDIVTDAIMSGLSGKNAVIDLRHAGDILSDIGMADVLSDWFLETVRQQVGCTISPRFWSKFKDHIAEDDVVVRIASAFDQLHNELSAYFLCVERLIEVKNLIIDVTSSSKGSATFSSTHSESLRTELIFRLQLIYCGIIFYRTTREFDDALNSFFDKSIRAFDAVCASSIGRNFSGHESDEGGEVLQPLTCTGCEFDAENCHCKETFASFSRLVSQLRALGVLERLTAEPVARLVHRRIEQHVEETCRGCFDTCYLDSLRDWLSTGIVAWMDELFKAAAVDSASGSSSSASLHISACHTNKEEGDSDSPHFERLYSYMCEAYGRTRIAQLFNIIVEFPESQPALYDLAECMEKVDLRSELVKSLRAALESRLLHPGVNTADILTAYISAIPSLRLLDRSGVLLDLVSEPVRRYLRGREDTVRCIVSSLTEDGNGELSDELTRGGQPLTLDDSFAGDDCAPPDPDWQTWSPDPIDAPDPVKSGQGRRGSDVISTLVNIYGSKELFINEYRNILANRILTQFSYDTDREIRYLELLKLRFGETHLHNCEVMLKDVADSRRINSHISEAARRQTQPNVTPEGDEMPSVNAMILSAQFWPPKLREEKVELPACLQAALEKYTRAYELLKGNRTLVWKPHLGLVSIDIELKDKVLSFNVLPVHATIIWHFQSKTKWTVDELSAKMQIPSQALQRKLAFWQSQGLLREESTDTFVLMEDHRGFAGTGSGGMAGEVMGLDEEEAESALASAQDLKEEELQLVWSYVVGMLTNLESLPIDRIHSMLKMFTMQGPGSQCTLMELKALLDRRIKEQKLTYASGVYRLVKH